MSARSTRGPGGGKIHGRRPPVRRGGGRSGSPPTASGQNVGGGWFSCPMAIPVLPVLLLFALFRHLFSPAGPRVWGARLSRPGPAPEPVTVSALRGTAGSGAPGGAM